MMYSATLNIPKKIGEFILPTAVFVAVNTNLNCIGFSIPFNSKYSKEEILATIVNNCSKIVEVIKEPGNYGVVFGPRIYTEREKMFGDIITKYTVYTTAEYRITANSKQLLLENIQEYLNS